MFNGGTQANKNNNVGAIPCNRPFGWVGWVGWHSWVGWVVQCGVLEVVFYANGTFHISLGF